MKNARKAFDLEALREIFADRNFSLAQATITKTELLADRSKWRALCLIVPDEIEVVAEGTWEMTGPNAGIYSFPVPGDLVLVGFTSPDHAFILRRLSSKEDLIPLQAALGNLVLSALSGKKAYLSSEAAILLGSGGILDPDEPLVLGNVLTAYIDELHDKIDTALAKIVAGPIGIDSFGGSVVTYPTLATDLTQIQVDLAAIRAQYVDVPSTNILSGIAFTERG